MLLKPLPYPEPDALVAVRQSALKINFKDIDLSPSDYFIFREQNRSFSSMGIWSGGTVTVTGNDAPEQVRGAWVTEGVLATLGIAPMAGRAFTAKDAEPDGPETVILTHAWWQKKFGGDLSAIGRTLLIDGRAQQIIGIMPANFQLLDESPELF